MGNPNVPGLTDCLALTGPFLHRDKQAPPQSLLSNKDPMLVLEKVIQVVSAHVKDGGSLVSQEDVLSCLRAFTADVTVPSRRKTAVLQLLESRFDLSGEDTFMLLFLQTEALVSATWEKKVRQHARTHARTHTHAYTRTNTRTYTHTHTHTRTDTLTDTHTLVPECTINATL